MFAMLWQFMHFRRFATHFHEFLQFQYNLLFCLFVSPVIARQCADARSNAVCPSVRPSVHPTLILVSFFPHIVFVNTGIDDDDGRRTSVAEAGTAAVCCQSSILLVTM